MRVLFKQNSDNSLESQLEVAGVEHVKFMSLKPAMDCWRIQFLLHSEAESFYKQIKQTALRVLNPPVNGEVVIEASYQVFQVTK